MDTTTMAVSSEFRKPAVNVQRTLGSTTPGRMNDAATTAVVEVGTIVGTDAVVLAVEAGATTAVTTAAMTAVTTAVMLAGMTVDGTTGVETKAGDGTIGVGTTGTEGTDPQNDAPDPQIVGRGGETKTKIPAVMIGVVMIAETAVEAAKMVTDGGMEALVIEERMPPQTTAMHPKTTVKGKPVMVARRIVTEEELVDDRHHHQWRAPRSCFLPKGAMHLDDIRS